MQRYNATVEGGSGRTRYFVSLGYTGQAGMFNTEKEQNYSTMGHRTKRFFQWSGKMGERF